MTNKNNIDELRSHLFDTLRGLKDGSVSVECAQAVSLVGKTIIDTAKVEIEFTKASGETVESKFLEQSSESTQRIESDQNGITSIIRHRLVG